MGPNPPNCVSDPSAQVDILRLLRLEPLAETGACGYRAAKVMLSSRSDKSIELHSRGNMSTSLIRCRGAPLRLRPTS